MWLICRYNILKKRSFSLLFRLCRKLKLFYWRRLLKNKNFSLISNNCLGGMITHDLGVQFNSPTVNLEIRDPDEYLLFLENLKYYVYAEIEEITSTDKPFPVGLLGKRIVVYFSHYKLFEEAVSAWRRRADRINWDNLFIMIQESPVLTYDYLQRFDRLPYSRKVAITHVYYPDIQCGFYISGVDYSIPGRILQASNRFGGIYYDSFDWVAFFNENKIQKSKI